MLKAITNRVVPSGMPAIGRRNFMWEFRAATLMPIALACVEGNVLGVIADKAFNAPPIAIALIAASASMANFAGFLWSAALHGKDRVKFSIALQAGMLLCILGIAAAPFNQWGIWQITVLAIVARVLMAGMITARADLWRANYGDANRARVTGRITMMTACVVSITALVAGFVIDETPLGANAYRVLYGFAIVLGGFGALLFSKIRWRGRGAHLSSEASRDAADRPGPRSMIGLLRSDRLYADYMSAQYILGFANVAAMPLFIVALSDVFDKSYKQSLLLSQAIPMLLPVLTIPLWARALDGMHVIRFRVYHSWVFVTANFLLWAGFHYASEPLIYAAQIARGVAFGGGMLAWNLGHHDFATRELANVYMGIHTTLTGIRGAAGPIIAAMLYTGVVFGMGTEDTFQIPAMRHHVFLPLTLMSVFASVMFFTLHKRQQRDAAA